MSATGIKPTVVAELQRQMNHEYGAAHAYTALAAWCAGKDLKGFARYFHKQAGEEHGHARRFADHLVDRGVTPELREVAAPRTRFESVLDVAKHARSMEQANTQGIYEVHAAATREGDLPAQVLLHWFISEQVEEEAWCDEMVGRVEAAGSPGGLMALDHHIERYLAESAHAEGAGS